jgi:hypothetical protein
MFPRFAAAAAVVAMSALPSVAAAQEADTRPASIAASVASGTATAVQFADDQATPPIREFRGERGWTTPLLTSLQAATIATQMLDVHSTVTAMKLGATEANPLMGGLANNRAAFIGVKAAMSVGLVYVTHQLAKENKMAAIVASAAINSAYLMIARHNYNVARGLR